MNLLSRDMLLQRRLGRWLYGSIHVQATDRNIYFISRVIYKDLMYRLFNGHAYSTHVYGVNSGIRLSLKVCMGGSRTPPPFVPRCRLFTALREPKKITSSTYVSHSTNSLNIEGRLTTPRPRSGAAL